MSEEPASYGIQKPRTPLSSSENNFDREKIELLIDKKIAEAKLDVSEKRQRHLITIGATLVTIVGLALPIATAYINTDRVDKAIVELESRFQEVIGRQSFKPAIECLVNDEPIAGSTLSEDHSQIEPSVIVIRNSGQASAKIRIVIFIKAPEDSLNVICHAYGIDGSPTVINVWQNSRSSSPGYDGAYEYYLGTELEPSDSIPIDIRFSAQQTYLRRLVPAMIRIFYGEPEPRDYRFNILIKG